MKKFFNDRESECRHGTLHSCVNNECWYFTNLTDECLGALHNKNKHTACGGHYLTGLLTSKGDALYGSCKCVCHQGKYYSPLSGRWV